MNRFITTLLTVALVVGFQLPCFGLGYHPPAPQLVKENLAKADIDECFNGIGEPFVPGDQCTSGQIPKANQAYLWGLTKAGDNLWFGTAANMICLVQAYNRYAAGVESEPYQNNLWTCEFGEGQYVKTQMPTLQVPDVFSDYRPPKIYTYNVQTGVLTDKTSLVASPLAKMLLNYTFGLRSAGALDGVVFLAGPVALGAGINLFAFNSDTGAFIGAQTLPQYQNIRKWMVLDGVLYAAVGNEGGGGTVLRWTGSSAAPFSFEEVGSVDGIGSEIVFHNGRVYVATWPSRTGISTTSIAGIWMSPVVPAGGLTAAHKDSWQKVWQADQYEPDPLNASIYGCGAMASYGGYLYWGTMHVQGQAALVFINQYNMGTLEYASAYFNSWRSTAVFRCNNLDTNRNVQLLYGDSSMPVYVPTGSSSGYWTTRYNKMGGIRGRYGESGFGNIYNNYTWTMAVYQGQLYVGTMDHSYLWLDWNNLQTMYLGGQYIYIPFYLTPAEDEYGADLWRFPDANSAAVRVSRNGLGNYTNYGFRSSWADDETGLYLGTANPANTARDSYGDPRGGWELIKLHWE